MWKRGCLGFERFFFIFQFFSARRVVRIQGYVHVFSTKNQVHFLNSLKSAAAWRISHSLPLGNKKRKRNADGGWRCCGCDATAAVDAPVVALKRNFEITHLQYIEPSNFEAHFDVEQNVSTFCRTNNDAFNEHTFNMNTQSNEYYNLPCETMTAM